MHKRSEAEGEDGRKPARVGLEGEVEGDRNAWASVTVEATRGEGEGEVDGPGRRWAGPGVAAPCRR